MNSQNSEQHFAEFLSNMVSRKNNIRKATTKSMTFTTGEGEELSIRERTELVLVDIRISPSEMSLRWE
jgi:hypothetical protein